MLSKFSWRYDDVNLGIDEVPPNTKCKISIPYIIENDFTSVSVDFAHEATIKDIAIQ